MTDLTSFERRATIVGDNFSAKDNVNKPLVLKVNEIVHNVKTKFNQDSSNTASYKPEGQDAASVDVADVASGSVFAGALLFNPALVDSVRDYIGHTMAVKFVYASSKAGRQYITLEPLTGAENATATAWNTANPGAFEKRRAELAAEQGQALPGALTSLPAAGGQDVKALIEQLQAQQA